MLASYDAAFGVFDPSRYGDPARPAAVARTLELDGTILAPYGFDDGRSPFDGTHRDVPARHEACQRGRGTALVDRSVRRQRLDRAVPGRNRTHDSPGVHAPN